MRIIEDIKLDFKDVLLLPKRSTLTSRSEVDLTREFKFKYSKYPYKGIPILVANMDTTGTIKMAEALHKFQLGVCLHKFLSLDELFNHFNSPTSEYTWYSTGITDADGTKWKELLKKFEGTENAPKRVVIDVANGHQEQFVNFIKKFRDRNPDITIAAGNIVTGDMAEALILAGADVIKSGIGPGSVCLTRKIAGVGMPQLSTIIEVADASHGLGGHIISDGGITCPGDVSKAFGANSDFVMCGGLFAGTDECDGEFISKYFETDELIDPENEGFKKKVIKKTFMKFYGMSSEAAMEKHYGGVATHRTSEGKETLVPYKGPVEDTVLEILGGLRSTMTYVGARKLKELSKRTTFVRVTQQINEVFGKS
jgi:GMP reductase